MDADYIPRRGNLFFLFSLGIHSFQKRAKIKLEYIGKSVLINLQLLLFADLNKSAVSNKSWFDVGMVRLRNVDVVRV